MGVLKATGCTITKDSLLKENRKFYITDFGAGENEAPLKNTKAVNEAVKKAAENGGTVVFPKGRYKTYTIRLRSNVNLYFEDGAILTAARTDITKSYEKQTGEGGNYDEPEINLYAGLQDHGHTYFANSLIYGADIENVMIYGRGLIDGSYIDEETGYRRPVLMGGDPFDNEWRNVNGHTGEWFGNKAIALVRCQNVVLEGFNILIGGHFAIIAEGVTDMLAEGLVVDTTRDAFDIDCCENVTVRNSTFNSLTDDAVVLKASYGAGIFKTTRNVVIEDCIVSGFDAGSVLAETYTRDKLVATDRCGPTARVKLGTESTCGYDLVTIRRVHFERSRGFALEAVDGSDLSNIVFTDCTMNDVSSSPVFIRTGDRARFPVTGNSKEEYINAKDGNVRLDNRGWVLPDIPDYQKYPAKRYTPSYNKSRLVTVDGHSEFYITDENAPARVNPANYEYTGRDRERKYYLRTTKEEISEKSLPLYANATGSGQIAHIYNIEISNLKVTNADPRYPIILMGLTDSKIKNVFMKNIDIEYRGGMKMEHATEQRQLNTNWKYTQYETGSAIQTLPWLVNTFFAKEEGLLPRADWNEESGTWIDNPYNVPELPGVYPEPSNWGILPAWGMYARHAENIVLENVVFRYKVEDERHPVVLDDVRDISFRNFKTDIKKGTAHIAAVTNNFKRLSSREYIPDEEYFSTDVSGIDMDETGSRELEIKNIVVNAPAPGTPPDGLYAGRTVAIPENGYSYKVSTENYPLPRTVFRPFFKNAADIKINAGERAEFTLVIRNPASEAVKEKPDSHIYNESINEECFVVDGIRADVRVNAEDMPEGAEFDENTLRFSWQTGKEQKGVYKVCFIANDGIIPEKKTITITVS